MNIGSTLLTSGEARKIAHQWHGGQWSPLYAFASSGMIKDRWGILREIRSNELTPDLRLLIEYIQNTH